MSGVREHRPNADDVEYLASLARIEVSPAQRKRLSRDLSVMLDLVSELPAREEIPEADGPTVPVTSPLAEDRPAPGLSRREALSGAPRTARGLVLVPRVLPR